MPALIEHRAKAGTINGFAKAEACRQGGADDAGMRNPYPGGDGKRDYERKCFSKLQCKILCEGANGPTTTVADDLLEEKKVFVVPDILANAGGVTASYFEWVQDRMGYFWTEVEVNQRLDAIMIDSFRDVVSYAESHAVNNRIAAYMLAIDRVAYTTKQRGMYA